MIARSPVSAQIWRFGIVAVLGLGLDFGVAWSLATKAHLPLTLAAGIGFAAGAVLNYLLHASWTFETGFGAGRDAAARGLLYIAGLALTAATRLATVALLEAFVFTAPDREAVTLLTATGVSFFVNYLYSRHVVFRPQRGETSEHTGL